MKRILTYCLALFWCVSLHAADSAVIHLGLSLHEAKALANESDKKLIAYFYFDSCDLCSIMEDHILSDKKLSAYLNRHFIIAGFNTSSDAGKHTASAFTVNIHPSFLFLDQSGKVNHQLAGMFTPEAMIQKSGLAFTDNSLSALVNRYERGENSQAFLLQLINALADAHQLTKSYVKEYLNTLHNHNYAEPENLAFVYRYALHHFEAFIPYHEPAMQFMLHNAHRYYAYFDSAQVNIRIAWVLLDAIYAAMESGNETLFREAHGLLQHFETGEYMYYRETDGRITGAIMNKFPATTTLMEYHLHNNNLCEYRETLDHYISQIWDLPYELNSLARELTFSENEELIERAMTCAKRSIDLKEGYDNTETYALLLLRTDQLEKARHQAEKALRLAHSLNLDPSRAELLLSMIRNTKGG